MTARKHWFKVPDSITYEPWTNDQVAALIRLQGLMNTRWARNGQEPEERGKVVLSRAEICLISGKHRRDIALKSLRSLAEVTSMSVRLQGEVVEIIWPKYATFQQNETEKRPKSGRSDSDSDSGTDTISKKERKRAPSAPPAARAPSPSKGKTPCPEGLELDAKARIVEWASKRGIDRDRLTYGWQAIRDWAAAGNKRQADWEATFRNALRKGWCLEGYTPPAGSTASRYRDADDVLAEAKRKQAEDEVRAKLEDPDEVGKVIDLSLRRSEA